jgi:hypothetical protein
MNSFMRSWELMKCSIQVVATNRRLLVFPILITACMCAVAVFFLIPIALWHTGFAYSDPAHWSAVGHRWIVADADGKHSNLTSAGYLLMAVIYLVSTFLATFFNVAFYSQILNALRGQPVSVAAGLEVAKQRLNAIIAWSLFTGLIGLIIRWLEERVGLFGRWVIGLIGLAWNVASVFVVPIIVMEKDVVNPVELVKTSAAMLKKTWGETLIGYMGLRMGGILVLIGSLVMLISALVLSVVFQNFWILGITAIVWFVALMATLYVLNVASLVYMGALYVYASEGVAPSPFNGEQMNMAWKHKSGGK